MHYVSFVLMGGAFRNSRFLMQNTWQTIGKMKCVKISLPYFYLTFHHAYRVLPKRRDKDDSYCRRIDQSTSPFIYSDNESATILGNVKGIESTRELVVQHAWFLSRLFDFQMWKKCEQSFCERCKWSIYTCERCDYNLTGFVCIDYHREKVIRKPSRTILLKNPCDTFVKPFIPSFWLKDW